MAGGTSSQSQEHGQTRAEIHTQNENAPESKFTKHEPLTTLLAIESLLAQFAHTKVRADFASGSFASNVDTRLLPHIDELRWSLFPRWTKGTIMEVSKRNQGAANHCIELLNRSKALLRTGEDDNVMTLPYAEWFGILDMISADPYWTVIPTSDRCTHVLSPISAREVPQTKRERLSPFGGGSIERPKSVMADGGTRKKKQAERNVKVEEIVISSSGSEDSLDQSISTNDSSTDSYSSSDSNMRSRRSTRRSRRSRRSRDIVTPPVFEMDGTVSLKDFLANFEAYFTKKYDGNTYDKTQKLSEFLTGDLQKVFNAKGGRKLKYGRMKEELVRYYSEHKVGKRSHWRRLLAQAEPEPGENYEIYGMRLTDLSERAFPRDKKEAARHLRNRFFSALPSAVTTKIEDAELALRATSRGKRKHLPFAEIVRIAADVQVNSRHKSQVMVADTPHLAPRPATVQTCDNCRNSRPTTRHSREFRRSNTQRCTYCQRTNHQRSDCWEANGLCRICGQDHVLENCPRYRPQRHGRQARVFEGQSALNEDVSVVRAIHRDRQSAQ